VSDGAGNFRVPPDAYERYMGRWSRSLAPAFADAVGVRAGDRVLDVGCGTGALATELVERLGGAAVTAVDPSEPSVDACAQALPDADVRVAAAESLPFPDDSFDAAMCQLVLNFVPDAPAGVAEMRRVTRSGGTVAAATWDYRDGMTMLKAFWGAATAIDPAAPHEGGMPYCTLAELEALWADTGLEEVDGGALVVQRTYADFDDLWEPFTFGVGPAGAYCVSLDPEQREALRGECFRRLGEPGGALTLDGRAWFVRGTV